MNHDDIALTIRDGISHIAKEQRPEGSFGSLSSYLQGDFSKAVPYSTTFFTSIILSCLAGKTPFPSAQNICDRSAQFLLSQKSDRWSWNYWARSAPERKTMPYPDDLDDTFAALAALAQYDKRLITGKVLGATVQLLTSLEASEGGPYRTWLVSADAGPKWQDIDLVINSTVGYFLSFTAGVHLKNIEALVSDAVIKGAMVSPYYPSSFPVAYFISRLYKGSSYQKGRAQLVQQIHDRLQNRDHQPEMTPLQRAMSITSLMNLGSKEKITEKEIAALIASVKKEGWKPYAFCIDPARDGKTHYAGSSALTAAFCVEALNAYGNRDSKTSTQSGLGIKREVQVDEVAFHNHVHSLAKNASNHLPPELRTAIHSQLDRMSDPKITLLPYQFHKALKKSISIQKISEETVSSLALANLYGWMAYTIYDDFLDEEGDPLLLSCANFFLRELTRTYHDLEKEIPGVSKMFTETVNAIDAANTWEQAHCRIPKGSRGTIPGKLPSFGAYENLADRSLGHAMGPLAELVAAGYNESSGEYQATVALLRHYLIARQLHDDAHDWADDLLRGQINSVGAIVLKNFPGRPLADLLPELRHFFWTTTIDTVVHDVIDHIAAARRARSTIGIVENTFMEETLLQLENAAHRTREERDRALEFLSTTNE